MTCRVVEASGLPVNALGEVVVALGIGTDEVVGTLPPNSFPIDNKRLSLRLPAAVVDGDKVSGTTPDCRNKNNIIRKEA